MKWIATIPWAPPMNTSATRRHWSHGARARDQWQILISFAFPPSVRPEKPLKRARITYTRITFASRAPDPDNVGFSYKGATDALVSIGMLEDDGFDVERVIRWEKGKRRKPETRIEIEELPDPRVNLCTNQPDRRNIGMAVCSAPMPRYAG